MDLQVAGWYQLQMERPQSIDLQLERQPWLQMAIDLVLTEAISRSERKVRGLHPLVDVAHSQATNPLSIQQLLLGQGKLMEQLSQLLIVTVLIINALDLAHKNVQDIGAVIVREGLEHIARTRVLAEAN